jgi:hypothetical protein
VRPGSALELKCFKNSRKTIFDHLLDRYLTVGLFWIVYSRPMNRSRDIAVELWVFYSSNNSGKLKILYMIIRKFNNMCRLKMSVLSYLVSLNVIVIWTIRDVSGRLHIRMQFVKYRFHCCRYMRRIQNIYYTKWMRDEHDLFVLGKPSKRK